jgi:hypothetical protein
MICAVADDLFPRPTCQGVKVQGVKVSSLISIALLWRPRARLPPRMVFLQEGPANCSEIPHRSNRQRRCCH